MSRPWHDIANAPRNRKIEIKGRRFKTDTAYTATAIWRVRSVPKPTEGFYPPGKADGKGPFDGVTHWRELDWRTQG